MTKMARSGYRAVAPYTRGYAPTSVPKSQYQPAALGQDVLGLLDAFDADRATVYGHDWGTAGAYAAAVLAPERIKTLVAASVPRGSAFSKAMITDPEQQRRSWYIFYFQTRLAELGVPHNDFAFIERLWRDWSPTWEVPRNMVAEAKTTLAKEGVLEAALAYYRTAMNPDYLKVAVHRTAALQDSRLVAMRAGVEL